MSVGQVCSKAVYEKEVAYHDSTEVSDTHSISPGNKATPIGKAGVNCQGSPFPSFWYITILHHVTVSN